MWQLQHLQCSCQAVAACIAAMVLLSEAAYKQLLLVLGCWYFRQVQAAG